jgi:hypothetical protein
VYVPATLKTKAPVEPEAIVSVPHESSARVAVCPAESPFFQPITWPTLA